MECPHIVYEPAESRDGEQTDTNSYPDKSK